MKAPCLLAVAILFFIVCAAQLTAASIASAEIDSEIENELDSDAEASQTESSSALQAALHRLSRQQQGMTAKAAASPVCQIAGSGTPLCGAGQYLAAAGEYICCYDCVPGLYSAVQGQVCI
jgi:hypothetical protein